MGQVLAKGFEKLTFPEGTCRDSSRKESRDIKDDRLQGSLVFSLNTSCYTATRELLPYFSYLIALHCTIFADKIIVKFTHAVLNIFRKNRYNILEV